MKGFIKARCLSIILLFASASIYAYDFESGGIWYKIEGNNVSVEKGDIEYKGDITIPEKVKFNDKTYNVTSIGIGAFSGCEGLTSVTISSSVTSIGSNAFQGCKGLTSITIPNSVTSIGARAFRSCKGLNSITIPNSVKEINEETFSNCRGLTSLTIPSSVTSIGITAFLHCSGLTSITIPNSVTSIGGSAFSGCSSLTSITIPNSVKEINYGTFEGCSSLTSVAIPNSVTSIGGSAFSGCSGLTSVTIPNSVTSIGWNAFEGCESLKSIHIEDLKAWCEISFNGDLIRVAHHLYLNGVEIIDIVIPDGVSSIETGHFAYCSGLTSVTIPNSVTSIKVGAFRSCNELTSIKVEGGNPKYDSRNDCDAIIETSSNTLICGCKNSIIPNNVTSIGESAFLDCSGLTTVDIPNGVKTIGERAFSKCEGLTSVTIPNSVTSIGNAAFYGCEGLTSVTVPNSVTSLGNAAFYDTGWYNNQPDGLVYAGKVAYKYKGKIPANTHITIEDGTLGIAVSAFSDCTSLTSITIPNSVTSIGSGAFIGCSGLTSITIPNSVTSIGRGTFQDCSGLTSITIPNSVTSIGSGAFQGCSGLTSITIPNSVTFIGAQAFSGCYSLNSLDLPSSVTSIGSGAFIGCSGLTSITIPNSVTSIGSSAFYNCESLTTIVTEIENPFVISDDIFECSDKDIYSSATLVVPPGKKSAYQSTAGWNKFTNIVEEELIGYEFEDNGIRYKIGENNTVSVVSKDSEYSGDVVIPSQTSYNGDNYTVTSIATSAFEGCIDMTSVTIPNSVIMIGDAAFYYCTGLITIDIPNGVTTIGEGAFSKCGGLTSVTIPGSVTSIGKNAFFQCYGLTQITSWIENPFAIDDGVFPTSVYNNTPLLVPSGRKSAYQNTAGWKRFQNIIELADKDDVSFTIDAIAYDGSRSGKTVVVKSVDTSKTWMEIPASVSYNGTTYQVTGIADDAFKGSSMGALIWNIEAALPNNAFGNASIGSNFLLYVKSASYAPSTVKNVVVDGTAQKVVLSDDGGQFYCPQAFTARSISYTHDYTMETGGNGKGWESLALPFFVQKISHNTRGEIVPFALYSSGSSQKPFWLAKFSGNEFKRTSAIEANEPYIIAMPNNKNYRNDYNLAGEVTFSAENAAVPKTPAFGGAFVPAFTPVTMSSSVKALNNISYTGGYDPGSCFIPNLRDVHPFEAYMTGNSSRGIIEINYDNGTTDMFDILFSTDDGEEVTIYTLGGLQVARATQRNFDAVWQQLPKGVYIVNGKKKIK